jgi:hypothetical protein
MTRVIDRMAVLGVAALAALALGLAGSSQAKTKPKPKPAAPAAGAMAFTTGGCDTPTTPFCNALMPPTPGWKGHVFKLSQGYPASAPPEPFPWSKYDPTKQPGEYLKAALAYFYEGNIRASDPTLNKVRVWYNAPWQDVGLNGREFIHGLTRERVSLPGELAPQQTKKWNNYAVGFYNAPGGAVIGQVWKDHGKPNPAASLFPNGTVAAKLLFTTGSEAEVPYLKGSPTWNAYVYADPNDPSPNPTSPRKVLPVRLLQIDIAVKDDRVASTTGWVFGTFVYGGGPGGPAGSSWTNVAPVGVMWGNDPGYSGSGPLTQNWLNPAVHMPHVGYQGRLNGPVDNPISSCMSCHGTGEIPSGVMVPPSGQNPARWFQNIKSGQPFDPGRQSTDYSLQIEVGISNFERHQPVVKAASPQERVLQLRKLQQDSDPRTPRDGAPTH